MIGASLAVVQELDLISGPEAQASYTCLGVVTCPLLVRVVSYPSSQSCCRDSRSYHVGKTCVFGCQAASYLDSANRRWTQPCRRASRCSCLTSTSAT